MKKTILIFLGIMAAMITGVIAQDFALGGNENMVWNTKVYDFGEIEKSVPVTATFEFENTRKTPVIVTAAKASCGCTVADYTREPIPVGESGSVTATYNAAKAGAFNKTVTLTISGSDEPIVLTLRGNVVE